MSNENELNGMSLFTSNNVWNDVLDLFWLAVTDFRGSLLDRVPGRLSCCGGN